MFCHRAAEMPLRGAIVAELETGQSEERLALARGVLRGSALEGLANRCEVPFVNGKIRSLTSFVDGVFSYVWHYAPPGEH